MGNEFFHSRVKKPVNPRLCKVSGYTTELLEILSDDPKLHLLFIPGNPGIIAYYKEFLEALYELLGGVASITAIGHISHSKKDWEGGRLFSLQEQIDHKVDFIREEMPNLGVPLVLVGHSIGAYIAVETLRRSQEKVMYCILLYPTLALSRKSTLLAVIAMISGSSILSSFVSFVGASLAFLPKWALRLVVLKLFGSSWSDTAVEATCSHLLQYHIVRNSLFMAMQEFEELSETPDWEFMRENKGKLASLFGVDDIWGPLHVYEEMAKQVPGIALAIEREGHTHYFSCSEAGSVWVARHVAGLIKTQVSAVLCSAYPTARVTESTQELLDQWAILAGVRDSSLILASGNGIMLHMDNSIF